VNGGHHLEKKVLLGHATNDIEKRKTLIAITKNPLGTHEGVRNLRTTPENLRGMKHGEVKKAQFAVRREGPTAVLGRGSQQIKKRYRKSRAHSERAKPKWNHRRGDDLVHERYF